MYELTYKQKRKKKDDDLEHEIIDVFIGKKTIFSILGFVLGGIIIGESLWYILARNMNAWYVLLIGLILFIISGIASRQFKK